MADDEQQCIFCHIASGRIPAKKVYEDEQIVAVLDINPAAPGHLLVLTKQHFSIMPQMPDDLVSHTGMVSKQLSHALLKALKVDGTTVFVANGVVAGQRAPHFLLHVIPRADNDGLALQLPVSRFDESKMNEVFDKLSVSFAKQLGVAPVERSKEDPVKEAPVEKTEEKKKAPAAKSSKLDDIAGFLLGK